MCVGVVSSILIQIKMCSLFENVDFLYCIYNVILIIYFFLFLEGSLSKAHGGDNQLVSK